MGKLEKADNTCKRIIRKRLADGGVGNGFSQFWTRDMIYGLSGNGYFPKVIDFLSSFQRADGKMPLTIERNCNNFVLRMFPAGIQRLQKLMPYVASYTTVQNTEDLDGTALTIINYETLKGSVDNNDFNKIIKAANWLLGHYKSSLGLYVNEPYGTWKDSLNNSDMEMSLGKGILRMANRIKKEDMGANSYSNVLVYAAFNEAAKLSEEKEHFKYAELFSEKAEDLKKSVIRNLWSKKGYLEDFVGDENPALDASANILAAKYKLLNNVQAKNAMLNTYNLNIDYNTPAKPRSERIDIKRVNRDHVIKRIPDYQDSGEWPHIGSNLSEELFNYGIKDKALEVLEMVADKINERETVFEVYRNGKPMKGRFGAGSDRDFLWGAGAFRHALETIVKSSFINNQVPELVYGKPDSSKARRITLE